MPYSSTEELETSSIGTAPKCSKKNKLKAPKPKFISMKALQNKIKGYIMSVCRLKETKDTNFIEAKKK